MEINQSLKTVLRRMRLSGMLDTMPDRVAYAKKTKLSYQDFLELVLQDEIDRRDQVGLMNRLRKAQFEDEQVFENFDWDAKISFDRDRVRDLFSMGFLHRKEDVIFMGHAGVGKTFLASALGHSACRANKTVQFIRADAMLKKLRQSRADNSTDRLMRKLISCDLLIIDDFGLGKLDHEKSCDFYELIIERHRRSSTIITSNRTTDEWVPLFNDPLLAQSALDRLAHNSHQIIMEGESYRPNLGPKSATANRKKGGKSN